MALLDFFKRAAPVRNPTDQPVSPISVWASGRAPTVSYMEAVSAEAALKHPVIFRCLNKLGSAVASVEWYAEEDPDVVAADRASKTWIKALNNLLQSPNDNWPRSTLLYWMALNYACYGRIPFKVGVGPTEPYMPTGIYPLTARFVEAIRDERGIITAYKYGYGETNKDIIPTRKTAPKGKAYAYEIVRPNLDGTFESKNNVNPLGSIGLPAQIVTLLLQRAADTASGHPNTKYIVACEKTLTSPQKTEMRQQIEDRQVEGESSGQVLFLFNTKVELTKLDNDLKDIHSKMPLDDMSRMICAAFGIPVALAGVGSGSDGAKYASNYTESRRSFWEDTIIPDYLMPISVGMTAALCPYGARICFDYDSIQAMADRRIDNAKQLGQVNFLTRDEKREITGFPPLPPGQGGNQLDLPPGTKDTATAATNSISPTEPTTGAVQ